MIFKDVITVKMVFALILAIASVLLMDQRIKMSNIVQAFGVPSSPLEVSKIMTYLGVGHTLVTGTLRLKSKSKHLSRVQPAWPIILPSVRALERYTCKMDNQVLFICDALAFLSTCNLQIIKPQGMAENIKDALEYARLNPLEGWKLKIKEPSISDYVNNATKPSFLNDLQTQLYKITPYDLRKTTQNLIIGYLAGAEPKAKLIAKLKTSHKLDKIYELIKSPKTQALKDAVALFAKNQNIELTALETGFETFEILYLTNSSKKTISEAAKKG